MKNYWLLKVNLNFEIYFLYGKIYSWFNMKKINYKVLIMIILSLIAIIFVYNDYFLYNMPILKVKKIENVVNESSLYKEEYLDQTIKGTIMNGKYKGKELTITNLSSSSEVFDIRIEKGTEVFVNLNSNGDFVSIQNIKRDKYLMILLVVFIDSMLLVAGKKGVKTLLSLFINIVLTSLAIMFFKRYFRNINMLILYIIVSILFIVLSLFITNGKSKKTLSAIVSSILSLFISFGLSFTLIKLFGKDLFIWSMEYIEAVHDYQNFFYTSILLCGLGAIMDIAITISSSLYELIEKNPNIEKKALISSGKEISKDIVGTMSNVMLFTVFTPVLPSILLAIKDHILLMNAIDIYGQLELVTVLCACISIVLTIPVSLYTSVYILKGKEERKW